MIGYPNDRKRKGKEEGTDSENREEANSATIPFDFIGSYTVGSTSLGPQSSKSSTNRDKRARPNLFMADMDVVLTVREIDSGEGKMLSVKDGDNYSPFLMDSGCSFHKCGNRAWFTHLEDFEGPTVESAGHQKHKAMKQGTICFKAEVNGKQTSFALTNVQYIPGFSNLISLGALKSKGVSIEFMESGFRMSSNGKTFATGSDHPKNLFKLDAEVVIGNELKENGGRNVKALALTRKEDQIMLWHRRLCHASIHYIQALVKNKRLLE